MAIKCSNCSHSQFTKDDDYGICRRFPPLIRNTQRVDVREGETREIKGYTVYLHPKVHMDDRCGEFLEQEIPIALTPLEQGEPKKSRFSLFKRLYP